MQTASSPSEKEEFLKEREFEREHQRAQEEFGAGKSPATFQGESGEGKQEQTHSVKETKEITQKPEELKEKEEETPALQEEKKLMRPKEAVKKEKKQQQQQQQPAEKEEKEQEQEQKEQEESRQEAERMKEEGAPSRKEPQFNTVQFPKEGNWEHVNLLEEKLFHEHPRFKNVQFAGSLHDPKHGVRAMAKFPKGVTEEAHSHSSPLEWLVLEGKMKVQDPTTKQEIILEKGSHWMCPARCVHRAEALEEAIVFMMILGETDIIPHKG